MKTLIGMVLLGLALGVSAVQAGQWKEAGKTNTGVRVEVMDKSVTYVPVSDLGGTAASALLVGKFRFVDVHHVLVPLSICEARRGTISVVPDEEMYLLYPGFGEYDYTTTILQNAAVGGNFVVNLDKLSNPGTVAAAWMCQFDITKISDVSL